MQYIDDIQITLFPKQLQLMKFYSIHATQKAKENVITISVMIKPTQNLTKNITEHNFVLKPFQNYNNHRNTNCL